MRTGNSVNQLQGILRYKAFIPNHLPFEVKIDSELQMLPSKADLALGRLDGVADSLPKDIVGFFILMYVRKEATLSSHIEGWLRYFLEGIIITSQKAVQTAREIRELRDEHLSKVAGIGKNSPKGMKLLEYLFRNPIVRIKDVETIIDISNPNAIALINKFIQIGILKEITGNKRYKIFSYHQYISLFT